MTEDALVFASGLSLREARTGPTRNAVSLLTNPARHVLLRGWPSENKKTPKDRPHTILPSTERASGPQTASMDFVMGSRLQEIKKRERVGSWKDRAPEEHAQTSTERGTSITTLGTFTKNTYF